MLDLGLRARGKIRVVSFPRQRIGNRRLRCRLVFRSIVGEQVVNQPRGGALQDGVRVGQGIGQM